MNKTPIGLYIFMLAYITMAILAILAAKPKNFTENQPDKTINIGYKFDKVGQDSVLTIKGKFVKELHGRVLVKVN